MKQPRFEDALAKLEKIVEELESGKLSLDESLKKFEEGIRLARACSKRLEEAEKRIEIVRKGEDGSVSTEPFEAASSGSGEKPAQEEEEEEGGLF